MVEMTNELQCLISVLASLDTERTLPHSVRKAKRVESFCDTIFQLQSD
jgi:hypothetical protein